MTWFDVEVGAKNCNIQLEVAFYPRHLQRPSIWVLVISLIA